MQRSASSSYLKRTVASSENGLEADSSQGSLSEPSESVTASFEGDALDELSEEEVRKAAEAIVQAAALCHRLEGDARISADTREFLVQAVSKDPKLTRLLFEQNLFEFELC